MEITELSYEKPGKVFRSAMPYSTYDPNGKLISEYKKHGISIIVMLSSDEECMQITGQSLRNLYHREGFEIIYLPIPDFGTPKLDELRSAVNRAHSFKETGKGIAIHCHAGLGRTGLFAACLAKEGLGLSGKEAIDWVRNQIPGAVEVSEQESIVKSY